MMESKDETIAESRRKVAHHSQVVLRVLQQVQLTKDCAVHNIETLNYDIIQPISTTKMEHFVIFFFSIWKFCIMNCTGA